MNVLPGHMYIHIIICYFYILLSIGQCVFFCCSPALHEVTHPPALCRLERGGNRVMAEFSELS